MGTDMYAGVYVHSLCWTHEVETQKSSSSGPSATWQKENRMCCHTNGSSHLIHFKSLLMLLFVILITSLCVCAYTQGENKKHALDCASLTPWLSPPELVLSVKTNAHVAVNCQYLWKNPTTSNEGMCVPECVSIDSLACTVSWPDSNVGRRLFIYSLLAFQITIFQKMFHSFLTLHTNCSVYISLYWDSSSDGEFLSREHELLWQYDTFVS